MRRIVAITGATATGKTDLAEELAGAIGGEVVCADARQVFRELDAGTGKPTPGQRAARPHHLFDALSLGERASAGGWARMARACCEELLARGVTPVLVGGSGLYLRALQEGLHAEPPHAPEVRARLRAELAALGPEALHARLSVGDPATAARLAPRDRQRIVRALEILEGSGRPQSWWLAQASREALAADWRVIEVTCDAWALAVRIEQRTRAMFAGGLPAEVAAIVGSGRREALVALRAIGYDEALALLEGRCTLAHAVQATDQRTRVLAKRQRTWFRHQQEAARLDGGTPAAALLAAALRVAQASVAAPRAAPPGV